MAAAPAVFTLPPTRNELPLDYAPGSPERAAVDADGRTALQPFGGSRASGTNEKATSLWNLSRWATMRAIKETFVPPRDWRYPSMRFNGSSAAMP